jgi:streptogramin lyase
LTFDRGGELWFTEAYSQRVGRFDVRTHRISEFNLSVETPPGIVGSPVGLGVDHEGIVWVADHGGSWIVRFDPATGTVTHFPTRIPPASVYPLSIPNGLLIDDEDRIWFSEHGGNSVGFLDANRRSMVEYVIPSGPISTSLWIALAPNGDVWFAEWAYNKIGVVHAKMPVQVNLETSVESLTVQVGDTLTLSISARSNMDLAVNGTWDYSWSSYNPNDLSVVFSRQYPSLEATDEIRTEAQVLVSTRVFPGNYTLAIGLNLGEIRVSTMLAIYVGAKSEPELRILLPVILVAIVIGALIIFRRRLFKARDLH